MARVLAGTSPERTSRLMIIAAVVFAALAALLVFIALQKNGGGSKSSSAATQDVVVANQDIAVNTKITADMIAVKSLPSDQVIAGAYATSQSIIGLPARYPMAKGEQVTTTKIGAKAITEEKDVSLVLAPGKRAVSIEVSEITSVGGLLLPGNFVDVIVVLDAGQQGLADNKAVTILQNVEILSVAQEAQQPVPAASDAQATPGLQGERPSDVKRQPDAHTVTVSVTPQEAQLLALLQAKESSGGDNGIKLFLALRPMGETDVTSVPDFFPPVQIILPPPPAAR